MIAEEGGFGGTVGLGKLLRRGRPAGGHLLVLEVGAADRKVGGGVVFEQDGVQTVAVHTAAGGTVVAV